MPELDDVWMDLLDTAEARAVQSGQTDIAEYLRLKLANDTVRSEGVRWLFETMFHAASEASRSRPRLTITREEPHNFKVGSTNMVGTLIQVQNGVRCVTLEAGWARTPSDGIMRNGTLAHARFRHFGKQKAGEDLILLRRDPLPVWLSEDGSEVREERFIAHFDIFLTD